MAGTLIINARIVTLRSPHGQALTPRRGAAMRDLGVIERGYVLMQGGCIVQVAAGDAARELHDGVQVIDAHGRVVLPGFVDCHTHACWAGERWDEWEMKLAGASYLDILAAGGGILSTVRAVRATTTDELAAGLETRALQMAAYGTTTIEVKSGYGLDCATELRMLDAISQAAAHSPVSMIATFLGGHAVDPACDGFVAKTIAETLPTVLARHPGIAVDAYCETGSWSVQECVDYFTRAKALGSPGRVHTDQFNSLGMIPAALNLGAVSVDHLEAASESDLAAVAKSSTIAVGLPATSFCLGTRTIRAREFIDGGGALALATNANPGSAPVRGMPIIVSFAVREMRLTTAEALTTVIWNAACVLGVAHSCASIECGKCADIVLWPFTDERALGYELAGQLPVQVWARGVDVASCPRSGALLSK